MILLPLFEQSVGYCGPAALVSLLGYYGKSYTEDEIADVSGSTREHGTHPDQIKKGLDVLGVKYVSGEQGTWDILREAVNAKTPVLVLWWSVGENTDGHYSVVAEITEDEIVLMDPEFGQFRTLAKDYFLEHWYDFEEGKKINQWYLYAVHG